VEVTQAGGFEPSPDWKEVTLTEAPASPTLVPGDRVLLLLEDEQGTVHAQNGTGTYRLLPGGAVASKLNPFASQFEGRSETEAVAEITAAVARTR
jgi:hypothetical protein